MLSGSTRNGNPYAVMMSLALVAVVVPRVGQAIYRRTVALAEVYREEVRGNVVGRLHHPGRPGKVCLAGHSNFGVSGDKPTYFG